MVFDWKKLGDLNVGRENLGEEMPVVVYRLLQYTMKEELTSRYGKDVSDEILRAAGYRAGESFAYHLLKVDHPFDDFIASLQEKLRELKIGILRIEQADVQTMRFTMTISEDLDCSGLPVTDETICTYDEGFIAGILECYTGKPFIVKEIDCWASGDRTCRFTAHAR